MKASSRSKLWQGTVSGGPSRQPDSFYRTARGERQHRPRWSFCRGDVLSAATTRSSATDSDSVSATMISAEPSGCGAESVGRARRPSRFCPTGWRRRHITVCIVDGRLASGLPLAILSSRRRRTVKIRRAYPIQPPCADGLNVGCSACGAG